MKLTDRQVHGFPFVLNGRKEYADDAVPGLSVRVGKTAKTFRLVIWSEKERKHFTIGAYDPPRFTLAMAREKARDLIARERLRADEPPRTTFEEALEIYYRVHLPTLRKASAVAVRGSLDRYFRPVLGKKPLADIKRRDIAPLLDAITHFPSAMDSSFRYLRAFLNWCARRGYIESAPTDRMEIPKRTPSRTRVLTPGELVAIWHAAPDSDYGCILKLCLLSAQRRGQWAAARREYISGDTITFLSHIMKSGKAHTLPLTPRMRALLPDRIGYLFPNENHIPFGNWVRNKDRLDHATGHLGFRLHDLRRTWATVVPKISGYSHTLLRPYLPIRAVRL